MRIVDQQDDGVNTVSLLWLLQLRVSICKSSFAVLNSFPADFRVDFLACVADWRKTTEQTVFSTLAAVRFLISQSRSPLCRPPSFLCSAFVLCRFLSALSVPPSASLLYLYLPLLSYFPGIDLVIVR